jgi:hypothetical protein
MSSLRRSTRMSPATPIRPGEELSIIPAISGGSLHRGASAR